MEGMREIRWEEPVFVVSAGRSGSTHLTNILNAHPDLAITHELKLLHFLYAAHVLAHLPVGRCFDAGPLRLLGIVNEPYAPCFSRLFLAHADGIVQDFYRRHFADRGFLYWGDKFQWPEIVPEIIKRFPGARFLYLIRDGRDRSVSSRHWNRREREIRPYLPDAPFEDHCRHWDQANRGFLNTLAGHTLVHTIRYEELVTQPREQITQVFDFLRLEPAAEVWHYIGTEAGRFFRQHGTSESPAASIGRGEREMTAHERAVAEEIMDPTLRRLGYE